MKTKATTWNASDPHCLKAINPAESIKINPINAHPNQIIRVHVFLTLLCSLAQWIILSRNHSASIFMDTLDNTVGLGVQTFALPFCHDRESRVLFVILPRGSGHPKQRVVLHESCLFEYMEH